MAIQVLVKCRTDVTTVFWVGNDGTVATHDALAASFGAVSEGCPPRSLAVYGAGALVARHVFQEMGATRTTGSRIVENCADLRARTNTTSHGAVRNPTPCGEIAVGRACLFFASSNFCVIASASSTTIRRGNSFSTVASLISTAARDIAWEFFPRQEIVPFAVNRTLVAGTTCFTHRSSALLATVKIV